MSILTYDAFVERMISKYEGGYSWTKGDAGGPTKYGITCYDLAEHLGEKMNSMAQWAPRVQALTMATALLIYKTKYATYINYDALPAGVDACFMDYAVNSGVGRPVLVGRTLLGIKPATSAKLDQTLLDAIKKADPAHLINAMCDERLSFMKKIRGGTDWKRFGGGWSARVADLRAYCLHLAAGGSVAAAPTAADLSKTIQPKAVHQPKTAGTATAGTAVAAAASAVAAGFNWWEVGGIVIAVLIGGVLYEAFSASKSATAATTVVVPPSAAKLVVPALPSIVVGAGA